MTDRERLIELLREAVCYLPRILEVYADHLLSRGVTFEKQGEWIERKYEWFLYKCNLCGGGSDYMYNYCPNCGARMKGAVNNE